MMMMMIMITMMTMTMMMMTMMMTMRESAKKRGLFQLRMEVKKAVKLGNGSV